MTTKKEKSKSKVESRASFTIKQFSSVSEREDLTTAWWKKNDIFKKSVEMRPENNTYSFLDGPPFVTGTPHYATLLPSIAKDLIPRYQTMKGKRVRRVWGWDCHGLPIEEIVERKIGLKNRRDIEEYGVNKFIDECRKFVEKTTGEWEWYIDKVGRWTEFESAYYTMNTDYMESVIWMFKRLYEKDLLYEGLKTLLYCTRCGTPISKFEITMDDSYSDMEDPAITVEFPITTKGEFEGVRLLAWTTTPWTMPANRALVVNEKEDYVVFTLDGKDGKRYVMAEKRLEAALGDQAYNVTAKIKGKDLVGLAYSAPYDYFEANKNDLKVYHYDGMVHMEEGTGIVHSAPGFGEIDTDMGNDNGLTIMFTVDDEGKFIDKVKDFEGQYVKDADPEIIKDLAARDLLFKSERIVHRYPYCYRCKTPLIQRSVKSWFVNIQKIKKDLLSQNEDINWVPSKFKHGRFKHTLKTAPDWSISRTRYWATIMPVWKCGDCDAVEIFGSRKEIEDRSGQKIEDLHRTGVDHIKFDCKSCKGEMSRVPEVLDVWMESGAMPFAEIHYPFENEDLFRQNAPADYIIEYVGQIRAWFYYMHVVANALFEENSFKNVVTTGVLWGTDGRKMSKSYGNYPDPKVTLEKYGGDALRLYFMSLPIMTGEDMNFNEDELRNQVSRVIFPFWNSVKYFVTYANQSGWTPTSTDKLPKGKNLLDDWILARLKETKAEVESNLDSYIVPKAVRALDPFLEDLSTWYIRRSRDRFVSGDKEALATLYYVLVSASKIFAPIIPFVTEEAYQALVATSALSKDNPESVHLTDWPEMEAPSDEEKELIGSMQKVRAVVSLGQAARVSSSMKVRQPLSEVQISGAKFAGALTSVIADELNVTKVSYVKKIKVSKGWSSQEDFGVAVSLDTSLTPELKLEGDYKEITRMLQTARKEAGLRLGEVVSAQVYTDDKDILETMSKKQNEILEDVSLSKLDADSIASAPKKATTIKINSEDVKVVFTK